MQDIRPLIVIVDDEADIADVISDVLQEEGYETQVFRDAATALGFMRDHVPALVLTDLRLRGVSGRELIAQTQALHGEQVPIVVMSGVAYDIDDAAARVQAYLKKPFDLDALCRLVERWAGTPGGGAITGDTRPPASM